MSARPPSPPPALPPTPAGLGELVRRSAEEAVDRLGDGLERAGIALAAPEGADLAPLLAATDLPDVPNDGALGALAARLDKEADLFRNVALRELARVAWVDRLTQTAWLVLAGCEVLVAACASATAVLGAEGRASAFLVAGLLVGVGGVGVTAAAARIRTAHAELARDALARAQAIEDRYYQVGLALEWRSAGPVLFQEALARLERERRTRDEP